jgi:hypothetical protein
MRRFEDAAEPLRLDLAEIVLRTNKMLIHRHESSAARYGGEIGTKIQREMAVGLVRGESIDQIARRLTGKTKRTYLIMDDTQKGAAFGDEVHEMGRWQAERLVRTEMIHAANVASHEQLEDMQEEKEARDKAEGRKGDDDDDDWCKMWDATADGRTCEDCDDLDGEIRDLDEDFSSGDSHPPLHPSCRCTVVPWRRSWGKTEDA